MVGRYLASGSSTVDDHSLREKPVQAQRIYAAIVTATCAFGVGAVIASESRSRTGPSSNACSTATDDAFKAEADLRTVVERLGYRVNRIRTDAACYEVLAVDRNGRSFEIKFKGADLRMVSRHESKGERLTVARP
jgi:hypothetical protein